MIYTISGYILIGKRKVGFAYPSVIADSADRAKEAVKYECPGAVIERCEEVRQCSAKGA